MLFQRPAEVDLWALAYLGIEGSWEKLPRPSREGFRPKGGGLRRAFGALGRRPRPRLPGRRGG